MLFGLRDCGADTPKRTPPTIPRFLGIHFEARTSLLECSSPLEETARYSVFKERAKPQQVCMEPVRQNFHFERIPPELDEALSGGHRTLRLDHRAVKGFARGE
uniref:Uncharacterized protein n=1 Tax=uncultured myxobacterium HF0200_01L06 TaxID=723556 RepID=E7C3J4_9BACT|nr:hypothetical protein [uncultured myxobacterium HF0200_01L06]